MPPVGQKSRSGNTDAKAFNASAPPDVEAGKNYTARALRVAYATISLTVCAPDDALMEDGAHRIFAERPGRQIPGPMGASCGDQERKKI